MTAVYNNSCSTSTGYVQYELETTSGTVLATGDGPTVSPGTVSNWNYPITSPPLQVGEQYTIYTESVSGSSSSGYDTTTTFPVDPRMAWGTQSWMTQLSWQPDSQLNVKVNATNGDMNITMAMLQSEAGVNLPIDLNFVSDSAQTKASGDVGKLAWDWIDTFSENLWIDPSGQSVTYFGPDGEAAAFTNNGSGGWNAPGDLPATLTKTSSGFTLDWNTADASHQAGQIDTFNSSGTLLEEQSATGETLNITYNSSNEPETITTSAGHTFDFNYYTSGSLEGDLENIQEASTSFEVQVGYTSNGYLNSIEDPDNGTTTFGYQTLQHEVTSITTPAGRELLIGYDSTGTQVTSVAWQDSDFSTNPTWTFTYNQPAYTTGGTQCLSATYSGSFECGTSVVQDPNGHDTTYVWDNADRVTKTTDANGESQSTTWNSDNDVTQLTNPNSNVETFTWDSAHDVLTNITNPNETLSGTSISGGSIGLTWSTSSAPYTLTEVSDPTNPSSNVTYTYNADHEISEVQDGLSSQNTETATYQGIGATTCGGLTGDLCSITDFDGNTTNYAYNSNGELTSITPPTNSGTQLGATTLGYNALGQITSEKDGRGDTTTYQWNGENQITDVAYSDGTCVALGYDADGNLQSITAPGGDSSFTYNPTGLMKTSDINGDSTSYTYDPVGNLLTADGPLGDTSYSYTNVNELYQVTDPWGNTTTFAYEPSNDQLVHTISLPGSVTETYGYDNADRVTSFVAAHSSTNLISDSYSYFTTTSPSTAKDANLLQSFTNTAGVKTTYTYDPLERLATASASSGGTSYSYGYNGDGDLTSQTIAGTTTSYTLNTNHENTADTFDTAGDLASASGLGSFSYNAAGQTSSITPSGGSAESIGYLADGQTVPGAIGSTSVTYNALGIDSTKVGSTTNEFLRTPDGQLLAEYTGGHPYYYLLDPTNTSVDGLTNTSGSLVNSDSYSPYGVQTASLTGISNPFQYDSGYEAPGTTLLHFGERYYNPSAAGWTQLDPTGQNPGFVFAADDPINLADLSGTDVASDAAAGCGKAVAQTAAVAGVASTITGQPELEAGDVAGSCLIGAVGGALGGVAEKAGDVVGDISDAASFVNDVF